MFGLDVANTVYAFDSTTIGLCTLPFPWARYRSKQHAMKLHNLLDLRGNITTLLRISPARLHDVNVLDDLRPEAGAFYVMDRGNVDFERLHRWMLAGALFVTRPQEPPVRPRQVPAGRQGHRGPLRLDHPSPAVLFLSRAP